MYVLYTFQTKNPLIQHFYHLSIRQKVHRRPHLTDYLLQYPADHSDQFPFLDKKSTLLPFLVEYLSKYIYLTCSLSILLFKFRQNLHYIAGPVEYLSKSCIYFLFMYYFTITEQLFSFFLAHHPALYGQNFHYLVFSVEFLSILCIYFLFYGHFPYVFSILDKISTILMLWWKFCL